jgi:hypothetical protein
VCQAGAGKVRVGPAGFLESRTARQAVASSTSTQLAPLALLYELLTQRPVDRLIYSP